MADLTTKQVLQKLGKDILNWVKTNCVDNLVSTSKNLPLSANQGRVLKEGQDAINQSLGNIPIEAVYVPARENTRIKVTIRDAHDHCLIFGEANHDPFACLITHAGCLNIIGNIDSERSELTFMLYVPNWTTATIIAPGTYDKNIIVTCD